MKHLIIILTFCFTILTFNCNSQIEMDCSGKVGINNSSPSYQLDVNGSFNFELSNVGIIETENNTEIKFGGNCMYSYNDANLGKSDAYWSKLYAWYPYFVYTPDYYSDRRLKKDIQELDKTLDKLIQLRPVQYKMFSKKEFYEAMGNDSVSDFSTENVPQIGLIAQEVQEIFPEVVTQIDSNYLGIKYIEFIPLLIKGLQEQQEEIESLSVKVEQLEIDCFNNDNLKSGSLDGNDINSNLNGVKLYQNAPNPFSEQTTIQYEIPESIQNARLNICNMNGAILKTIAVNQRGSGNVLINANEFNAGMYLYSLVCDGSIVDTKQMLLTE